jgi:hypothetical protein
VGGFFNVKFVRVKIDLFATGHPEYSSDRYASLTICPCSPALNVSELPSVDRPKRYDVASTGSDTADAVGAPTVTAARTIPAIAQRAMMECGVVEENMGAFLRKRLPDTSEISA